MTGERLRKRLKTIEVNGLKIVLSDIAAKLGMKRQQLNSKLNAKRIDDEFLTNLAAAIGVTKNQLLTEDEGGIDKALNTPNMTPIEQLAHTQRELIDLHKKYARSLEKTIELQDKVIAAKEETVETLRQWTEARGRLNRH